MAVGYYNHSIWLLGGSYTNYYLTEFDIDQQSFINHGTTTGETNISWYIIGGGQYYTQINNTMYFIEYTGWEIMTYTLDTKQFTRRWQYPFPTKVGGKACLASTSEYLFVVGGESANNVELTVNNLRILELSNKTWIASNLVPSMAQRRANLACIVHPTANRLYAIGGRAQSQGKPALQNIEYLDLQTIGTNTPWTMNPNDLLKENAGGRAIIYKQYVWVVGGFEYTNSVTLYFDVQSIDTTNDKVEISVPCNGLLYYRIVYSSAIIVSDVVYLFGGTNPLGEGLPTTTDNWQYCNTIPTPKPTKYPTLYPTTSNPTFQPSQTTANPTLNPSQTTVNPTFNPTFEPTFNPTIEPTAEPTFNPTSVPTVPSYTPSANPSFQPSQTT
eukprot:106070_1